MQSTSRWLRRDVDCMMPHVASSERVADCGEQPRIESMFHLDTIGQRIVLWYSLPSCAGPHGDRESQSRAP
eukprot:10919104-Prorocentrum_lima.AAC.1